MQLQVREGQEREREKWHVGWSVEEKEGRRGKWYACSVYVLHEHDDKVDQEERR